MADTAFDRTERGLGSTSLSVADIVAKTRGNPQQIMQLVMGGQINLTQGLLAKRLADSVVAEQQKAAMPTTTVLQDAFPQAAPPQQAPAAPPPQAPQGMGPVPGAPPMPPQPPMQAPMQAPQGMAEGGLAQLDFAADDYAGGGMVSFAEGGPLGPWFEEQVVNAVPGVRVTSGMRSAADNARVGGVANSYHRTDNARDFAPPEGMSMAALHSQLRGIFGEGYDIINEGDHVHVEPGGGGGGGGGAATSSGAASGARSFLEGIFGGEGAPAPVNPAAYLEQLNASNDTEAMDRYRARLEQGEDPERARQRAELGSLFEAIGNVRAGMSPLEALAQGFATSGASLQEAEAAVGEREMERMRAVAEIEQAQNTLSRDTYQLAVQLAQYDAGRLDAALGRRLEVAKSLLSADEQAAVERARVALGYAELDARQEEAAADRAITKRGQTLGYLGNVARANAEGQGGSFQDQVLGLTPDGAAPAAAGAGRIVSAVPIPQ